MSQFTISKHSDDLVVFIKVDIVNKSIFMHDATISQLSLPREKVSKFFNHEILGLLFSDSETFPCLIFREELFSQQLRALYDIRFIQRSQSVFVVGVMH